MDELKKLVRQIPDYPKPGILFYDLTTLFQDRHGFRLLMERMVDRYAGLRVDAVAGIEARGFVIAPVLAYELGAGFVPVRKPGKLPWKTAQIRYQLEYGTDGLEIHEDAVRPGQRVLVCDDLLATGGTAQATIHLLRQLGGEVMGACFAVELTFLHGRSKLDGVEIFSLLSYDK
ncbi:MAG TPA: adenine phosphoribosyltransferase [Candidatus Acidoferrales bacterium]|nr:adenine phosphoribosyltransferase [Candidatus Acidoferrales bacterium]